MEIFDVFRLNGIENYPTAGEKFLENFILKVSQTLFQGFYPKGGGGNAPGAPPLASPRGAYNFLGGGGGCEVPCLCVDLFTLYS